MVSGLVINFSTSFCRLEWSSITSHLMTQMLVSLQVILCVWGKTFVIKLLLSELGYGRESLLFLELSEHILLAILTLCHMSLIISTKTMCLWKYWLKYCFNIMNFIWNYYIFWSLKVQNVSPWLKHLLSTWIIVSMVL